MWEKFIIVFLLQTSNSRWIFSPRRRRIDGYIITIDNSRRDSNRDERRERIVRRMRGRSSASRIIAVK